MIINSVVFVGVCREVEDSSILLENQDCKLFRFYFANKEDIRTVDLNVLTKIEGYVDVQEFPFPIIMVEKVYQLNNNVN